MSPKQSSDGYNTYNVPSPEDEGRRDQYPENMIGRGHYRDTGCAVIISCLECPLAVCLEDRPQSWERAQRNEIIYDLIIHKGRKAKAVALELNLSTRTVHRIVQNEKANND